MIGIVAYHKIIHMASVTVDRRAGKFIYLLVNMTGFAVGNGMRSNQRETAFSVKSKYFLLILPAIGGVAALAINAKLPLVNIGMAICASSAHFCEF